LSRQEKGERFDTLYTHAETMDGGPLQGDYKGCNDALDLKPNTGKPKAGRASPPSAAQGGNNDGKVVTLCRRMFSWTGSGNLRDWGRAGAGLELSAT
jgi:hypothetical protein